jgi:hypothetical protein
MIHPKDGMILPIIDQDRIAIPQGRINYAQQHLVHP